MRINTVLIRLSKRKTLLLSNTRSEPNVWSQKPASELPKPNPRVWGWELPSAQNPRCHFSGRGKLPLLGGVVYQGSIRQAPCWEVATRPGLERTDLYLPAVPKEGLATTKIADVRLPEMKGTATDLRPTLSRRPPPPRAVQSHRKLPSVPRPTRPGKRTTPVRDAAYLCGLSRACARLGKSAATAAAAGATVKSLGPGRGTAQPEYRAPRASRPKRI